MLHRRAVIGLIASAGTCHRSRRHVAQGSIDSVHGNIATTSTYLHAQPENSSGLRLDPGVFLR